MAERTAGWDRVRHQFQTCYSRCTNGRRGSGRWWQGSSPFEQCRLDGGRDGSSWAMVDTAAVESRVGEGEEGSVSGRVNGERMWCQQKQWRVQAKKKRKKGDAVFCRGVCELLHHISYARQDWLRWINSIPRSRWGYQVMVTAKHFLAGAVSAAVARTSLAPLERVKLEYLVRGSTTDVRTTVRDIFWNEGPLGFWKGNFVNVLRSAPFKAINFYAFDWSREFLKGRKRRRKEEDTDLSNVERLVAGAFAGVMATLLCFPMDTIRTRLVAKGGEKLGGIGGCFKTILRNEGYLSLYRGLLPGLMSIAPAGAVFYGVCDLLKSSYLKSEIGKEEMAARLQSLQEARERDREKGVVGTGQMELGALRTLMYGAIAGACAETVTYPLEVLRRQLQLQGVNGTNLGMRKTIGAVIARGGLPGLYAGWLPSTIQVLPSAALSYYVYEFMKAVMCI